MESMATARRRKKASTKPPPEKVARCKVSVAKLSVLNESLEAAGIDPSELEEGKAARIQRLATYFADEGDTNQFADCSECGGVCDVEIVGSKLGNRCPYCGVSAEDDAEPEEDEPEEDEPDNAADIETEGETVDESEAPAPAPVVALDDKRPEGTIKQLDKSVSKVNELKRSITSNFWTLGREIGSIHEKGLWKLRTVEGVPVYKSFETFCRSELGIVAKTAYRLMGVARAFSEKEVAEIGARKLAVALQLPKAEQDKALEAMRQGASTRQIERTVRELRDNEGEPTPPAAEKVTVALLLKRQRLPLFARPKNKAEKDEPRKATSIADDPWTEIDLDNGVILRLLVTKNKKGELVQIVEAKRVE